MNTGSRRCSTSGCAASAASWSIWIHAALVEASRRWRPPVAGVRRSTGGSSVALTIWSSRRRDGLPQVNPGTIVLLLVAAIGAAWAAGLIRPHYEDGRLTLRAFRAGRVFAAFDFRDTGLLLMLALTGSWASWWIFRRRNGLVALLPTGTILAVEIINDVIPGPVFFTVVWLAAAASVLLRLNFVALKEGWRTRHVPHAADTGWTFGEVGIEATVAILAIAFLILPPLSSADISGVLIPGVVHADFVHPFGLGGSSQPAATGSVGYSETVRPGAQLTAKSKTVMRVDGDSPSFYPYWRGLAPAGRDGLQWYELPSTRDIPVRLQPLLAPHATLPRDDLPASLRLQVLHTTFHVLVPPEQTTYTVFSAGEIISVDNQPSKVRGIMTSVGTPLNTQGPALVNVTGDNLPMASFDTVDKIQFAKRLHAPYTYP